MQDLRHLFNGMLGQLRHGPPARIPFDEAIVFPVTPGKELTHT
ncbi:hypothetical protein ABZY81_28585 [Streptomyces sp. NPDC006514]